MSKWTMGTCLFIILIFGLSQLDIQIGGTGFEDDILSEHVFIDDVGNKIIVDKAIQSIISLSSVHTENLYEIGVEHLIIGVDEHSIFPYEVTKLPRYRLNKIKDIEAIIKSNPDLILIDTRMNDKNSTLVSMFETANIKVVSLMPEKLEDFDGYMKKLGILVGKKDLVLSKLKAYKSKLDAYQVSSKNLKHKKRVFVEASENGYATVLKESLVGRAIELAGGILITPEKQWFNDDESSKLVGEEFILSHKDDIDLYVSLRGYGYSGASKVSISQKDDFSSIKAIQEGQVYELMVPLIGQYTFRYLDGIKEMHRLMYGSSKDFTEKIQADKPLSRFEFAALLYEKMNLQTFTIIDKDYYDFKKFHHTYGAYLDVDYADDAFNIIETVTMLSYIHPIKKGSAEYFKKDTMLTKEAIETFMYIAYDLKNESLTSFLHARGFSIDDGITKDELINLLEELKRFKDD